MLFKNFICMQKEIKNIVDDPNADADLFGRAVKGGAWVFAIRLVTQLFSVVRLVVLARFLGVEEMGLLGIGMLMIQILNTFTTTGFQQALIQKKENIHAYLDTVWTVGIIRAIVLFAVLYFAAPYAAMLRIDPEKITITVSIIRVIGLTLLIDSFSNIATIYFQKELQFHKQFIYRISGTLIDSLVTISIVLIYKSVWALVFGKLSGSVVRCLLGYMIYSYKPALKLNLKQASRLWKFGKWIFGGSVIDFLVNQGDDIFVLGYFGAFFLAIYQMAYKFANIPATEISNIIGQVSFPAFSKIQGDTSRLRDAYLKILQTTTFLSIPIGGLIIIMAPDFVRLFLTEKWQLTILPMQVLALLGLNRAIGATRGPLFRAIGKPNINFKFQLCRLIILIALIYPFARFWGITGVALILLISGFGLQIFGIYLAVKVLNCRLSEMLKPLLMPFIAAIAMLIVIGLLKVYIFLEITVIIFFVIAIIGTLIYLLSIWLLDKYFEYGISKMIQEQIRLLVK